MRQFRLVCVLIERLIAVREIPSKSLEPVRDATSSKHVVTSLNAGLVQIVVLLRYVEDFGRIAAVIRIAQVPILLARTSLFAAVITRIAAPIRFAAVLIHNAKTIRSAAPITRFAAPIRHAAACIQNAA